MADKRTLKSRKALRKKRAMQRKLRIRRGVAAAFAVCAVIVAIVALRSAPSLRRVLWLIGAALMLGHAALLFMKRPLASGVYALTGMVCILALVAGSFTGGYVYDRGRYVPASTLLTELRVTDAWPANIRAMDRLEVLDMRDSTVTDFAPLTALTSLRSLDVRGNAAFTRREYDMVSQALPGCQILWSLPVGDQLVDSDVQSIDLTGSDTSAEDLRALFQAYPDKQFTYEVALMGRRFSTDATALDLTGSTDIDPAAIADALTLLPNVTQVDLRGTPVSADTIAALQAAAPGVHFLCTCDVPSGSMTTEDQEVVIPGGDMQTLQAWMRFIDYMPNLKVMDARAISIPEDQLAALQADPRSAKLLYSFTAFGRTLSTLETELNLDGMQFSGVDEVERCVSAMPNLQRVSMLNCNLSYQDMAGLCDRHPDVMFVWWVSFGQYKMRTDATAFTTGLYDNNKYNYTSDVFEPLKYCKELMMLDIGHCKLTSIDFIANMKKLRVLILADNKITDLSPLAGLEDLEYVEIFLNKVSDFTPLANKTKLLDLNIYYNPVGDVSPICTCTSLERVWAGECGLSKSKVNQLKKALPNAKINTRGSSSTGNGWRDHRRYKVIKKMYKTNKNGQCQYYPFS